MLIAFAAHTEQQQLDMERLIRRAFEQATAQSQEEKAAVSKWHKAELESANYAYHKRLQASE